MQLDIDPNTHPAWTGGSQQLLDSRRPFVALQLSRFGAIGQVNKK